MFIFTGRFQPFHNGHLSIIEYLSKKYPNEIICVAIIKDYPFLEEKSDFDKRVDIELSKKSDALDAEKTLHIITNILQNRGYKNTVVTLMPRASSESWKVIESLFDCNRIWVFTDNQQQPDSWEELKRNFYVSMNEDIILVPIEKTVNGTDIRFRLKNKDYEILRESLPKEVIDFYKKYDFYEK